MYTLVPRSVPWDSIHPINQWTHHRIHELFHRCTHRTHHRPTPCRATTFFSTTVRVYLFMYTLHRLFVAYPFLPPTISKTSDMLTMAFRPRPCLNQSHSPQNNYTTPYLLRMTLTMHRSTGTHHVVYFQNESCMVCLCSSLPETQSCRSRRGATADGGASMVWWMMWFVGLSSAFVDRASAPPLA